MTKENLRRRLEAGGILMDLLPPVPGQECEIYKAERFIPGSEIIYIPDFSLNELPYERSVRNEEEIEEIMGCCYTGDDFIGECEGDIRMAEQLFCYCDWQHPSSAYPEMDDDE